MSHPNHHDPRKAADYLRIRELLRSRPPPPPKVSLPRGQRRPRSPEAPIQPVTPPRNSSPELTLITKSPHSKRTVKKGKTDVDIQPVPHPTSYNHTPTKTSQTYDPRTVPSTKTTPTTNLPAAPGSAQDLLEFLTTQLETVLRTVDTLLHNHSDTAHLDTSRAKQVLRHLNDRLNPGAANHEPATPSQHTDRTHAPTQKKTYAEATVTPTTKRPAGAPRTHHHKTGTKPVSPKSTDFGRLIVDFGRNAVNQLPPAKIKDELNDLLTTLKHPTVRVAGAQFSRMGNLVLTITPASSTKHILASDLTAAIISHLRGPLGLSEKAVKATRIYPADAWHRLVVHNIPLRDFQQGPEWSWWDQNNKSIVSDWKEYNPLVRSAALQCSKALRFLVPDNFTEESLKQKGTVSMCIAFDNVKYAHKLIREGAFLHGTHCRVSSYRPMTRPRPGTK